MQENIYFGATSYPFYILFYNSHYSLYPYTSSISKANEIGKGTIFANLQQGGCALQIKVAIDKENIFHFGLGVNTV